jgi:hypothetical protein
MFGAAFALLVGGCEYFRPLPATPAADRDETAAPSPDPCPSWERALRSCATPEKCGDIMLRIPARPFLGCQLDGPAPLARFGTKAIPTIVRLLSPEVFAHRRAFGTSASSGVAKSILANPDEYADSAWPLLIEVAVGSGMNSALRQTIVVNAPKHAEWFVRDLMLDRAASSLDLYSRARIVLRVLGRDANSLSAAIADALKRELPNGIPNAEKLVEVLGFIGDRRAVPTLIAALNHQDWEISVAASRALARLGPDAAASEPSLVDVEQHHWLSTAKQSAGLARRFVMSGWRATQMPTGDEPRALIEVYEELRQNDLVDEAFRHIERPGSFDRAGRDEPAKRCQWHGRVYRMKHDVADMPEALQGIRWSPPNGETVFNARQGSSWLRVHDGHLLALNKGEFGSVVLHVDDNNRLQALDAGSARWLARTPRGIVVISGLSHWSAGSVHQLWEEGGAWRSRGLARLPAAPLSYAIAADGTALVSTESSNVGVGPSGKIDAVLCDW